MTDMDGWPEWSNHVLQELKRLSESNELQTTELSEIRVEIATLKVKSGVWGAAAGAIPSVLVLLYMILSK